MTTICCTSRKKRGTCRKEKIRASILSRNRPKGRPKGQPAYQESKANVRKADFGCLTLDIRKNKKMILKKSKTGLYILDFECHKISPKSNVQNPISEFTCIN